MGIHPVTDELYMALYHEFSIPTYITRRYSVRGEKIRDYEMIMNYWFPSLPLFPEGGSQSGIHDILSDSLSSIGDLYSLNGILVKRNIEYGDWTDISKGIYIWKSGDSTKKVLIR